MLHSMAEFVAGFAGGVQPLVYGYAVSFMWRAKEIE